MRNIDCQFENLYSISITLIVKVLIAELNCQILEGRILVYLDISIHRPLKQKHIYQTYYFLYKMCEGGLVK